MQCIIHTVHYKIEWLGGIKSVYARRKNIVLLMEVEGHLIPACFSCYFDSGITVRIAGGDIKMEWQLSKKSTK